MQKCETTEQIKLFSWASKLSKWFPELGLMYHVPNEGKRKVQTAKILKAAGLKKGVPDICLPVARWNFHGLYIELKFNGNKPTKEQKEYIKALNDNGYRAVVCNGFEAAREEIRHYIARDCNFDFVNCEDAVKRFDKCEGYKEEWTPCRRCPIYLGKEKTHEPL